MKVVDEQTRIAVGNPNEYGRLKTVVMCLATPYRSEGIRGIDAPLFRQILRNRFASYDYVRVRDQQLAFAGLLEHRGARVLWADKAPGHPIAQHYTRDVGFAIDDVFFVARPRRGARQAEIAGLRNLLKRFSKVAYLDSGTIEGGDMILDTGRVIVGLGEETNLLGVEALKWEMAQRGIEREVVVLRFAHRGVIHLDTKLNVVSRGVALVHRNAFTPESVRWIENNFDLVEVTDEEARSLAVNAFAISPHEVVVGISDERVAGELERRGLTATPIDYSEVNRLPGSFRCTTMPLAREDAAGDG